MNLINLKIVTPEGIVFEGNVKQATIPTTDGEITVLANHAPLISVLKEGTLILKGGDVEASRYKIVEGFLEVRHNSEVVLLPDTAEEEN